MFTDKKLYFQNSGETSETLDLATTGTSNYFNLKTAGYFDGGKTVYLNFLFTEAYASTGTCPIVLQTTTEADTTFASAVTGMPIASLTTTAGTPQALGSSIKLAMPFNLRALIRVSWTATNVTAGEVRAWLSVS